MYKVPYMENPDRPAATVINKQPLKKKGNEPLKRKMEEGISIDQVRVFYEIALAIGSSQDLNKMLKNSIVSYIRKLNCTGAAVVRLHRRDDGSFKVIHEFSLPYIPEVKQTFQRFIRELPPVLPEEEYRALIDRGIQCRYIDNGECLYTFHLPDFGLLMLTRRNEPFAEEALTIILELNRKLADSAKACIRQQELEESEARYRDLTETLPEMIFETDHLGFITYVNQYALDRTGYSRQEANNRFSILNVITHEDHDRIMKDLKRCLEQGQLLSSEYQIRRKNDSEFTGVVYMTPIMKGMAVAGFRGVVLDVTDRKLYESRLKEYADRLELALSGSGSGMWDWNMVTGQIVTHGWYERIIGRSAGEVQPTIEAHLNLIHPDDREAVTATLDKHIHDPQQVYSCEYRVNCADGSWKWLLDTGMVVETDAGGRPLRMTGIQLDINQKKIAEEHLRHNLQQQELISEIAISLNNLSGFDEKISHALQIIGLHSQVSRTYVFEDDPSGEYTSNTYEWCAEGISSQQVNLICVPYEMVPGWKERLVHEGSIVSSDISSFPDEIKSVLESQEIRSVAVYPIVISGRYAGFIGLDECISRREWSTSECQMLKTISGIISNAFERRLAERSLSESVATNRAMLSSLPDKLLHCNKNGDILNFNFSENENYFLQKPEKSLNLAQVMSQTLADLFLQSISICIDMGSYHFSFENETLGAISYFETRLSKVNETEAILLVRDVTQERYQQDKLRNAIERAEKANQTKSEFLANMSHEIRTPMNGVIGMASLLSKTVMTGEQREMVDTIRNSGDLLLSIINDILDFSKIESGNMELEISQIDLNACMEEAIDQFYQRLNEKKLLLTYFIDAGLQHTLLGDRTRLNQIMVNLIGNAIKFTPEGGITIRIRGEKGPKNRVKLIFSIQDTGIGISEDKIPQLFKPFSQLSSANNRRFTGTGLGLAITARLVKLMGGEIGVSSVQHAGSDFYFHVYMDQLESNNSPGEQLSEGITLLNAVTNNRLREQIQHFTDITGIQTAREYVPGTLVITDAENTEYPVEHTIRTGMLRTFHESQAADFTLPVPIKLSSFLKAVFKDKLRDAGNLLHIPDPEDLHSRFPIRILVAEDNRTNQKLMLQTLNYYGYLPQLAKNGLEALDALEKEDFHLIFMDIQMPEMDGLEATRIINRTYKHNRPVIVAMTASALIEEKELCFMAGVDDYLSKPAKIESIGEMIQKWGEVIMKNNRS
jgi:PAS domain S-box-containing protein